MSSIHLPCVNVRTWKDLPLAEKKTTGVLKGLDMSATLDPEMIKRLCEKAEVDDDGRTIPFTSSTDQRDRENDRIRTNGIQMGDFKRNPIVPWAHLYRMPPLGTAVKIWRDKVKVAKLGEVNRLRMLKRFAETDFAEEILHLVKTHVIRGASIGFRALKAQRDPDLDETVYGILFEKIDLYESSIVPIPANPGALAGAKGLIADMLVKGSLNAAPIIEWTEKVLDGEIDAKSIVVPIELVREARDVFRGKEAPVQVESAGTGEAMPEELRKQLQALMFPNIPDVKDFEPDAEPEPEFELLSSELEEVKAQQPETAAYEIQRAGESKLSLRLSPDAEAADIKSAIHYLEETLAAKSEGASFDEIEEDLDPLKETKGESDSSGPLADLIPIHVVGKGD